MKLPSTAVDEALVLAHRRVPSTWARDARRTNELWRMTRIDTKSQQHGVLDVKRDKPGKQFTAWVNSGKRFIPVQLVLDGRTNSWYLVPGIPTRTLGLDPLVTTFDPAEPLAPFKVVGGCLDDLPDMAVFLSFQEKLRGALSGLLREKEIIMKAVDADYLIYLKSTAEDVADNPELLQAIAANDDAMQKLLGPELFEVWKKTRRSRLSGPASDQPSNGG